MQNKSSKNLIKFIFGFILVTTFPYALGMIVGVTQLIRSPKTICMPVDLEINLENEGYMLYEDSTKLDITFSSVQGKVIYKKGNLSKAPIAWGELFFPITRVTLLLFIIILSTKLMQTSLTKEPFIKINAYRLEGIGYCILLMGGLKYFESQIGVSMLQDHLVSPYVSSVSPSAYTTERLIGNIFTTEIPVGLFVLFIAAIFKHGIHLQQENELTI